MHLIDAERSAIFFQETDGVFLRLARQTIIIQRNVLHPLWHDAPEKGGFTHLPRTGHEDTGELRAQIEDFRGGCTGEKFHSDENLQDDCIIV